MKKAREVSDRIFWWIGMHKTADSSQFVWNSTNQTHSLVNSWEGGKQTKLDMKTESCVGFNSSVGILGKECGGKYLHSPICQFGKWCSYYQLISNHSTQDCPVRREYLLHPSSVGVTPYTRCVRMTPCVWMVRVYQGVTP